MTATVRFVEFSRKLIKREGGFILDKLLILAVIVEGLVTYSGGKYHPKMVVSAVLGVVVAVCFRVDMFAMLGLHSSVPFVSLVLSGIIIGRGSNYVADVIKIMNNER